MKNHYIPFQMHLEQDQQGRIIRRIEQVAGQKPRVQAFTYDRAGLLTGVSGGVLGSAETQATWSSSSIMPPTASDAINR